MDRILPKRSERKLPIWERGMNPEQLEAIRHGVGPLRLLAAAGSGKTRCVVHRVVRLVEQDDVEPYRICAVTFSKKAADEMQARAKKLGIRDARFSTWHSLCYHILREDHTEWSDWEVDKHSKSRIILKDILGYKGMNWSGADPNKVEKYIGFCKANLFEPDSEGALLLAKKEFPFREQQAAEAYSLYCEKLAERHILTFDDYLVFVAEHFKDEDNRKRWAEKYDHLIQDEYQDTNHAQVHIAHCLAKDHRNYMAVGDVFQSIYSWRGSKPEYLAQFDQQWPDAKTIWLGMNYRSGKSIIEAANGIIRSAKVPGYEPKDMVAAREEVGKVVIQSSVDFDDEAVNFVELVKLRMHEGASYSDFTVLFRTNAQSRALEDQLLRAKYPYVVVGGHSFYERKEVRNLLAYLRVVTGKGETEDIKRCINMPYRYLGAAFTEKIMTVAEERGDKDWPAIVLAAAERSGIQRRQVVSANEWCRIITTLSDRIVKAKEPEASPEQIHNAAPAQLLEYIIRDTRYIEFIQKEEGDETIENSGASNVREMVRVAEKFKSAKALLKYVDTMIEKSDAQRKDSQAGGDRILIMSIHRSKGLEWPCVWVAGCNEMVLPHTKGDLEEERRLAYVAATRAEDTLVLSYVKQMATRAGVRDAQPSRFLYDTGLLFSQPVTSIEPLSQS